MADQPALETGKKPAELFISYASPDLARAQALHDRLVAAGFSVWFDKARLNPGCDWHKEIEAGCEAARMILPLLTPDWQNSEWTKYETYAAPAVLPIIAQGTRAEVMTPPLRRLHAPELDPLTADDAAWEPLFAAILSVQAKVLERWRGIQRAAIDQQFTATHDHRLRTGVADADRAVVGTCGGVDNMARKVEQCGRIDHRRAAGHRQL
jgi:hypothetical protein